MQFSFEVKTVLTLEHHKEDTTSKHVATDFNLEVSDNLNKNQYLQNDLPTAEGSKCITNVLIQGLIGNIHHAHEKGYRNDAEHLRFIIDELQKGFVAIPHLTTGNFKQ